MSAKNFEWVLSTLKKIIHQNSKIEIDGTSQSGDGYMGNITFLKIINPNEKNSFDIIIKLAKDSPKLRKDLPLRENFEKEIFIYTKVKTAMENYIKEIKFDELIGIMPECYATDLTEGKEMLILENLKPKGYELWNRKKTMDGLHIESVLKTYSRWHALSFVLRSRKPEVFQDLIKNNVNVFSEMIKSANICGYLEGCLRKIKNSLIEKGCGDVAVKFGFNKKEIEKASIDLFFEEPETHVFLHGDCWTNNYLFKYDKNTPKPTDVKIIDWQGSGLGSPVFDLSFFLYACCNFQEFPNIETLLKLYYDEFKQNLIKFQCVDIIENVFPYRKLLEHWKKFSRYGFLINLLTLKISLCDPEEAPDFANSTEVDFVENFNKFHIKEEEEYLRRGRANFIHYAENSL